MVSQASSVWWDSRTDGSSSDSEHGAYGREVAQVIESVVCCLRSTARREFRREDCGFGYGTSHFKHGHLRASVRGVLRRSLGPADLPRYPELCVPVARSAGI